MAHVGGPISTNAERESNLAPRPPCFGWRSLAADGLRVARMCRESPSIGP
ncbi:hypothetical protein C725_2452 [Pacificimonas flava]|uniref:Uncharacterized protein n=1 Tax=Pacificimonas flava TaxID=1234595 RepID=M2TKG5_9SPHN|nr:hypothetical protein C725_2452 [Pacificimonas flava]